MHTATAASPNARSNLALTVGVLTFRLAAWAMFNGNLVADPGEAFAVSRIAQLVGIVVLLSANLVWEIPAQLLRRLVGGAACVMALTVLYVVIGTPEQPALVAACSVHGLASAVLIIGWGVRTCLVEPRRSAVCVAIAFALYGVATFALSFAPTALTAPLAILAPLACGAAMAGSPVRFAGERIPRAQTTAETLGRLDWGTVGLLSPAAWSAR